MYLLLSLSVVFLLQSIVVFYKSQLNFADPPSLYFQQLWLLLLGLLVQIHVLSQNLELEFVGLRRVKLLFLLLLWLFGFLELRHVRQTIHHIGSLIDVLNQLSKALLSD